MIKIKTTTDRQYEMLGLQGQGKTRQIGTKTGWEYPVTISIILTGYGTYQRWVSDGSKSLTAQNLLFIIYLPNFITLHNYYKMSFRYQITEDRISDVINAFYNGDYTNPIAAARVFGISAKTIHPRLDRRASKSLRLPFNRDLSLEQEQVLRNYIQQLNKMYQLKYQ